MYRTTHYIFQDQAQIVK